MRVRGLLFGLAVATAGCGPVKATPALDPTCGPTVLGHAGPGHVDLENGTVQIRMRAVEVVHVDGYDVVGWLGPERYQLRVIAREGDVVAERSWPYHHETLPVSAPRLFARPSGLVVVRTDGVDVVREFLDLDLTVMKSEVLVEDGTRFSAIDVGEEAAIELGPEGATDLSFNGVDFLFPAALGHGTWHFQARDATGERITPAIEAEWTVRIGSLYVKRLAPRAHEIGRHAAVVVGGGESIAIRIEAEEATALDPFVGDATIAWASDRYLVLVAGSVPQHASGVHEGIYLVEVDADGTLRTPVEQSLLLAPATAPSHPSMSVANETDETLQLAVAFIDGEDVVYRRIGDCP